MKTAVFIVTCLVVLCGIAYQQRFSLLLWFMPRLLNWQNPIGPNVPVEWERGPDAPDTAQTQQPNIILILADDMGFNDVSMYGGGLIDTPNIDSIARDGVKFTNAYAGNAVCSPSRATVMTGRYSTRFGFEFTPVPKVAVTIADWMDKADPSQLHSDIFWENANELPEKPIENLGMPTEEITVAEVLQSAGYHTAHIGKWHLGKNRAMDPQSQGFNESLNLAGTLYLPEKHPDVVNGYTGKAIDQMVWCSSQYAVTFNNGSRFEPNGYLTDYFTDEAVKAIGANKNRPFFMYLAHWGIHNPLQSLKSDYEALSHIPDHNTRVYAGMIRALDRGVGKVLDALKANGLDDNTIVLFSSDNGGANYLGLTDINKPYRGWKLSFFEGGTHVPSALKWPAKIKPGQIIDKRVHHSDIMPTFAAVAGNKAVLPAGHLIDGINLLDVINDKAAGHHTLFWLTGNQSSVIHGDWKLIVSGKPDKAWLFDLAADPTEQINVVAKHPAIVAELKELLVKHRSEQQQPGWPCVIALPILIDKPSTSPYVPGDEYAYWNN